MLKTFALTIVIAAFAIPASASTGAQNHQSTAATLKNVQLAQNGGVFCRKGTRYDYRQRTCVPQ